MTRAGMMVVAAVAVIGAGCATSSRSAYQTPPPATSADTKTSGAQATTLCPMDVPGAHIATADTPDGEALTFTTSASQPEVRDQLREAVRAMADKLNGESGSAAADAERSAPAAGATSTGSTGSADASSTTMHSPTLPASHSSVEDVGEGIRLTVTPDDPADLDRLRSELRMRVDRMLQSGTCPT